MPAADMTKQLFIKATAKFLLGFIIVALLLFVPAWSLGYGNGWLLLALLFVPMFGAGLVMMAKAPSLLEKRLNAKGEQGEQRTVLKLSAIMFIAAFVAAGLNFRFSWFKMPRWTVWRLISGRG